MPRSTRRRHKKLKACDPFAPVSSNKADESVRDDPPVLEKESSATKKFSSLLALASNNGKTLTKKTTMPKGRLEGESYEEFSRRIRKETQEIILQQTTKIKRKTIKKKEYLKKKKDKKKQINEDYEEKVVDHVRFGEVVDKPPDLKGFVAKKRSTFSKILGAQHLQDSQKFSSRKEFSSSARRLPVASFQKNGSKEEDSTYKRRQLELVRKQTQEAYQQLKKKRRVEMNAEKNDRKKPKT